MAERRTTWQASTAASDWLEGKDPADLDVIELGGRRLYPDTIRRRGTKGDASKVVEVPVRLRVPSTADKALARLDALRWARELVAQQGTKVAEQMTIAVAESLLGRTYFDELDTKCLLARCMFEADPPHDQYLLYGLLDSRHDHASLMEVWDRLNFYWDWEEPRTAEVDEGRFLAMVAAIDRVRNLSPLAGIAGSERVSFILSMASRLLPSPTGSSGAPSTASSTPAASTRPAA
jgi:hypothetical protein